MLLVIRTDGDDNALSPENARNKIRLHFKRGLVRREVGDRVTRLGRYDIVKKEGW